MIKTVTEMEFVVDFPWAQVNVFNSYTEGATLIGFYCDDAPMGFAIVKQNRTHLEADIFYSADGPDNMLAVCYGELLDAAMGLSKALSLPVAYSVPVEHKNYAQIDVLLMDRGFSRDTDKRLVLCIADEATKNRWYDFLNHRGNALIERLVRRGLVNIAYKDLTCEQKEYVHIATKNEFQRETDPKRARLPMDGENSFFTFHSGCLVSFCMVSRVSKSQLIVEFMGAKKEYRTTGAFLMPLISFITNTFNYDCTQTITFMYHAENREMDSISSRLLPIVINSVKTRAYYYLFA